MVWEHQKSGMTIFFDIVRHILILAGTSYVLFLIWNHSWIFALFAAIPVYVIMLNLFGFLTLPLYLLTPENRAKSKMLKTVQKGDLESLKSQTDDFAKQFNVNVPEESPDSNDVPMG